MIQLGTRDIVCVVHVSVWLFQEVVLQSQRPTDGQPVSIKIKLVRVLPLAACVQQMNVLFRKWVLLKLGSHSVFKAVSLDFQNSCAQV